MEAAGIGFVIVSMNQFYRVHSFTEMSSTTDSDVILSEVHRARAMNAVEGPAVGMLNYATNFGNITPVETSYCRTLQSMFC